MSADLPSPDLRSADRASRFAALTLGMALPTDVLLYLLLPMYAGDFGLSLAEVGVLLAANRLVRIVGYGSVARFYGRYGDRFTSTLAVVTAGICALGYTTLSGVWLLLPLRLLWGLAFAALNLSSQVLATAQPLGVARRALQLPLVAPLVTQRNPGAGRVQALAANSVWRDIGAGTGPLLAGSLLPIVPSVWMYGVAALALAVSAVISVWPQQRV